MEELHNLLGFIYKLNILILNNYKLQFKTEMTKIDLNDHPSNNY